MKDAVLLAILLESLEVSDQLRESLSAAAKLLQHCTCQERRRQDSLAAVGMADAALDRLEILNATILNIFGKPPNFTGVIQ